MTVLVGGLTALALGVSESQSKDEALQILVAWNRNASGLGR